jgi:hypothetical protein
MISVLLETNIEWLNAIPFLHFLRGDIIPFQYADQSEPSGTNWEKAFTGLDHDRISRTQK